MVYEAFPCNCGAVTVNVEPKFIDEGVGVTTTMVADPGFAISEAGTCAFISVEDTYIEVSGVNSQSTVSPAAKFVPVTVSVKSPPPATVVLGERDVTVGAPVGGVGPEPPPGFSVPLNPDPHPAMNPRMRQENAKNADLRIDVAPASQLKCSYRLYLRPTCARSVLQAQLRFLREEFTPTAQANQPSDGLAD